MTFRSLLDRRRHRQVTQAPGCDAELVSGIGSGDEADDLPQVWSACYAPHSALYLRPDGLVHACCTTGYAVGSVFGPSRQSLRQIWDSVALAEQRRALETGDFSYSCQECELAIATGGRETATAYHFDRYAPGAPHTGPRMIDFALSNRCNLQCVMCNGGLSSAIRSQREHLPPLPSAYDDRFFEELDELLPDLERAQFKGGEPFLARENRRVWDSLIRQGGMPEVTVTTNGTIFNEDVERYVSALRAHVNISVDAMDPTLLGSIRVGLDARTLWANADRFQTLAEAGGQGMTLSFCLMSTNWRELLPFLREADQRGVNANVIAVNQPARFDLNRLPHDELVAIHQDLASIGAHFANGDVQREWDAVLMRLRSQLECPVELVVRSPRVSPAPSTANPPLSEREVADLRSRLTSESHCEPVEVTIEDWTVTVVDVAAWADWLAPQTWLGSPLEALEPAIAKAAGGIAVVGPSEPDAAGVHRRLMLVDGGSRRVVAIYLFRRATGTAEYAMLVPATPPPRAEQDTPRRTMVGGSDQNGTSAGAAPNPRPDGGATTAPG